MEIAKSIDSGIASATMSAGQLCQINAQPGEASMTLV